MKVTDSEYNLLKSISDEIDSFFKNTYDIKEARSTDIYDFIKNRAPFKKIFPNGKIFNQFLRKMQRSGLLKEIIPNSYVDTSIYNAFKWRFYRKEIKKTTNEIKADYRISDSKLFKGNKIVQTNNGELVRSQQEKYIYNRLLNEQDLLIYYERPLQEKYPDFTVANRKSKIVYHWEHFGMTNQDEYLDKIDKRINWYLEKGYKYIEDGGRLIVTFYKSETEFKQEIEKKIELIKL